MRVRRGEERRPQEALGERGGIDRGIFQRTNDRLLALDRAGRAGLLRPLDDALMVRGRREVAEDRFTVGREVRREDPPGAVDQREVVAERERQARERRPGLIDRRARLQHVPGHDRDPETIAQDLPATEGQGDGQPGVVHPIQEAPQAIAHADHAAVQQVRRPDDALEPRWRVVVVAGEQGPPVACPRALRARGEVGRGPVERQHPRREITAAGQLDHPLVRRHELRHVRAEHPGARRVRRARLLALAEEPLPVVRPSLLEDGTPAFAELELLDRAEREREHPHGGQMLAGGRRRVEHPQRSLNPNGSGSCVGGSSGSSGTLAYCALTPEIQPLARSSSSCSSFMNRPRVTRMPRSAPG